MFASQFMPEGSPEQWAAFVEVQRRTTSARNARRLISVSQAIDVTEVAPAVTVPTLVLHATRDRRVPLEQGQLFADLIPGATFVPLESHNHILLGDEPAWKVFVEEVERFISTDGLSAAGPAGPVSMFSPDGLQASRRRRGASLAACTRRFTACKAAGRRSAPPREGARAMAPWLVGIAPLGFVIGVTTARADIPAGAGWLAGPLIFSGGAQAVTIQLLDAHAGVLVVIAGGLVVNLRLVLYSAAMARHWRAQPAWWNALAAYTLVDPSAAVALEGYERSDDAAYGHAHYLGAAATLAIAWLVSIALGATFGAALPRGLRLEFVIPLYLVGQLLRRMNDATAKRAVTVAVVLALIGAAAPLHLGTLIAITGGTVVAIATSTGDDAR